MQPSLVTRAFTRSLGHELHIDALTEYCEEPQRYYAGRVKVGWNLSKSPPDLGTNAKFLSYVEQTFSLRRASAGPASGLRSRDFVYPAITCERAVTPARCRDLDTRVSQSPTRRHHLPMAGGFCIIESNKQNTTRTPRPPATIINRSPHPAVSALQFLGRTVYSEKKRGALREFRGPLTRIAASKSTIPCRFGTRPRHFIGVLIGRIRYSRQRTTAGPTARPGGVPAGMPSCRRPRAPANRRHPGVVLPSHGVACRFAP
jgi:hypothetical protein